MAALAPRAMNWARRSGRRRQPGGRRWPVKGSSSKALASVRPSVGTSAGVATRTSIGSWSAAGARAVKPTADIRPPPHRRTPGRTADGADWALDPGKGGGVADVVVTGGGIGGLMTAMLLARDGNEVTLLERDAEPVPAS